MKNMKNIDVFLIIVIFGVVSLWINNVYYKETQKEIQELKIMIQQRAVKDTLYWDHLESCSFIHKDSIGVGYQSYLYSKYHREHRINN